MSTATDVEINSFKFDSKTLIEDIKKILKYLFNKPLEH